MAQNKCFVNELPAELLGEIFIYSIQGSTPESMWKVISYQCTLSHRRAPLSLTAVCQLWRVLAFGTPKLWDAISPTYNSIPIVKFWLNAIPQSAFHLRIAAGKKKSRDNMEGACAMFRLLSKEYQRWRSLLIELDSLVASEFLMFLKSITLGSLTLDRLEAVVPRGPCSEKVIHEFLSLLSSFSCLEHLNFESHSFTSFTIQDIPWPQLKTFRVLHESTVHQFAHYLSQSASATSAEFQTNYILGDALTTPRNHYEPPLSLSCLTTLILGRGTDPLNLLAHFTLPNIQDIILEVGHRNHSALESFIKRTPSLQSLLLQDSFNDWGDSPSASYDEIVDWLTHDYLYCLPSFQLNFYEAHTAGVGLIKNKVASNTRFPSLTCWTAKRNVRGWMPTDFSVIGWHNTVKGGHGVYWTFSDGEFRFTDFFYRENEWDNEPKF
ncbi:hypothetical protein CPB83DRAFT_857997 [Crepidotus variabilis]|uniref:F-box domain-containing protein n=1 Tax=Crepidotus variabilis TaxID=179855 RepID=A0A9P6ECB5_9AGAR|nr:hypothetical protein CPB83DRAFT_857997 [Crepidotus variabilis]